jgi:hypothetical protein
MENPKKVQANQSEGEHPHGGDVWEEGGDDIQAFKKIWRRVFNKRIGCYEIYVGNSNILVATGLTDKSDSFLVGTIPLMVKLLHSFCRGCVSGKIDVETYDEAKKLIKEWRKQQPVATRTSVRKRKGGAVDRIDLLGLYSSDNQLEQTGGGSYSEAELLP